VGGVQPQSQAAAVADEALELRQSPPPPLQQQQPAAVAGGADTPAQREFKATHSGVARSWQLPHGFPSDRVQAAYLRPLVDRNSARFGFARPDEALLSQFCRCEAGRVPRSACARVRVSLCVCVCVQGRRCAHVPVCCACASALPTCTRRCRCD
jgi:hypothetical protein